MREGTMSKKACLEEFFDPDTARLTGERRRDQAPSATCAVFHLDDSLKGAI